MIFDYFWGKMCLFLGSLWRALQRELSRKVFSTSRFLFCVINTKTRDVEKNDREVCVTVGLSSEVYLLPTSNKVYDF